MFARFTLVQKVLIAVNKTYISDDFIHPSKKGIELISQTIADFIFNNKIFPE